MSADNANGANGADINANGPYISASGADVNADIGTIDAMSRDL